MDTLFSCLRTLSDQRFGTIVHVGAGDSRVLQHYANVDARRVVLIEGDADIGAELQRHAAPNARVEVLTEAVAARTGPVVWHRYNLQALNGPIDAAGLTAYYPRLCLLGLSSQAATEFGSILAKLPLVSGGERANVLILDVAGQDDSLLASLPDEQVHCFGVVLIRGCSYPSASDGASTQQAADRLLDRSFSPAGGDHESEPLWPVRMLRLDNARLLQAQTLAQERLIGQLRSANESAAAEAGSARQIAQQRLHEIESLQATSRSAFEAAQAARLQSAEMSKELESTREALEALQVSRAAQDEAHAKKVGDLSAQIATLTTVRDEQTKLADDRYLAIAALSQEKSALEAAYSSQTAKLAAVISERDVQTKLADDRYLSINDLTRTLADLQSQVQQLSTENANGQAKAAEIAAKMGELSTRLDADASTSAAAISALEVELDALRAKLQEATTRVESVSKERDEHKHWHFENERWGQGLKTQNEQLTATLSTLRGSNEMLASQLAAAEAAAKALDSKIAEGDARQRLMDAEILKTEAQLDLIKDVLIREKNF